MRLSPKVHTLKAPVGQEVCDFCNGDSPAWSYPCADFKRTVLGDDRKVIDFTGCWWACQRCHSLIETGAWLILLNVAHPDVTDVLRAERAATWLQFRQHRTGDPVHGRPS